MVGHRRAFSPPADFWGVNLADRRRARALLAEKVCPRQEMEKERKEKLNATGIAFFEGVDMLGVSNRPELWR